MRRDQDGDAVGGEVWIRSQKRRREIGSTPEVGSSRNRIGGLCRMAQPSARRCFQPPASAETSIVLAAVSPAMPMA